MGSSIRFTKPCSTCGRNIEIPIAHLGREVACGHCGARFVASIVDRSFSKEGSQNLDDRIDRLLAVGPHSTDRSRTFPRTSHAPSPSVAYEV
jgi:hypothetical protein